MRYFILLVVIVLILSNLIFSNFSRTENIETESSEKIITETQKSIEAESFKFGTNYFYLPEIKGYELNDETRAKNQINYNLSDQTVIAAYNSIDRSDTLKRTLIVSHNSFKYRNIPFHEQQQIINTTYNSMCADPNAYDNELVDECNNIYGKRYPFKINQKISFKPHMKNASSMAYSFYSDLKGNDISYRIYGTTSMFFVKNTFLLLNSYSFKSIDEARTIDNLFRNAFLKINQ